MTSAWASISFLRSYHEDRLDGNPRDLGVYLERFPGQEEEISAEYARLQEEEEERREDVARRFGRFRLLQVLGRGGQATVWCAEEHGEGRKVALKILDRNPNAHPSAALRVLREETLGRGMRHPGICRVRDAGIIDGQVYVQMDLVPGLSLAQLLSHAAPGLLDLCPEPLAAEARDPRGLLRLVEDLARSLHVAHESGVIHRDIKPGNIMVTPTGAPVVLDFGLGLDLASSSTGLTRTRAGGLGTPAYMAPEQIRGTREGLGRGTDIWALAVVLCECLCGRRPFAGAGVQDLYRAILEAPPQLPPAEIPLALRPVLLCALHKDPTRRYATALELADELRRVRRGEPTLARPPGVVRRVAQVLVRHPVWTTAIASTVLFSLGFGVYAFRAMAAETRLRRGAETAQVRALAAQEEAERRAEELRKLLDTMVWDLHSAIRDLPGAAPARRLLLEQAASYLRLIEDRRAESAALRKTLIATYIKLGDVQGHPGTQSFGDLQAARRSYRRAQQLAKEALELGDAGVSSRYEHLLAQLRLAELEAAAGETERARSLVGALRAGCEELAAAHPDRAKTGLLLISMHTTAATTAAGSAARTPHMRAALAVAERLYGRFPDRPQTYSALSGTLVNLGLALEAGGDVEPARAHLQRAHELLLHAARRYPQDFELQDRAVAVVGPYARLLARAGHWNEAEEMLDQAIRSQQDLVAQTQKSLAAVRRLCRVCGSAVHLMRGHGQRQKARAYLDLMRTWTAELDQRPGRDAADMLLCLWSEIWEVQDALETGVPARALAAWPRCERISGHPQLRQLVQDPGLRLQLLSAYAHVLGLRGAHEQALQVSRHELQRNSAPAAAIPGSPVSMLLAQARAGLALGKRELAAQALARAEQLLASDSEQIGELEGRWCQALCERLRAKM